MPFEHTFRIEISPGPLKGDKAQRYCEETRNTLAQVWTTNTGNTLLTALSKTGFWTLIRPYDGKRGPCNATADPVTDRKIGDRIFRSEIGFTALEICKHEFASLPNEYLHHELVHALRQTTKMWMPLSLPNDIDHYGNYEELYAVVMTNVHIADDSNTFKSKLRGSYKLSKGLEPELADSLTFFASSPFMFPVMNQFCEKHKDYTTAIAGIKAWFNPIASIYQHKWAAEQMSISVDKTAAKK